MGLQLKNEVALNLEQLEAFYVCAGRCQHLCDHMNQNKFGFGVGAAESGGDACTGNGNAKTLLGRYLNGQLNVRHIGWRLPLVVVGE